MAPPGPMKASIFIGEVDWLALGPAGRGGGPLRPRSGCPLSSRFSITQGCSIVLPEDFVAREPSPRSPGVRGRLRMVASLQNRRCWAGSGLVPGEHGESFSTEEALLST